MKQATIKKNTHTQRKHGAKINALATILGKTGIKQDDWLLQMFEYGCQIAEYLFPPALVKKQLQQKEYNYWSWFLSLYLSDDQALLEIYEEEMSAMEYWEQKQYFINELMKKSDEV